MLASLLLSASVCRLPSVLSLLLSPGRCFLTASHFHPIPSEKNTPPIARATMTHSLLRHVSPFTLTAFLVLLLHRLPEVSPCAKVSPFAPLLFHLPPSTAQNAASPPPSSTLPRAHPKKCHHNFLLSCLSLDTKHYCARRGPRLRSLASSLHTAAHRRLSDQCLQRDRSVPRLLSSAPS
ncbi:hypothetical protein TRVL_04288 [Trypanosoma vivax]|nr:hypothetical protein TRVL_04288 [Trypanosoma vivax]